jgi:hypothetical protein
MPFDPLQIEEVIDLLEVHREPLEPVGELDRDRRELESRDLLEVRVLGDLHPIEPHFPAEPPRTERRRLQSSSTKRTSCFERSIPIASSEPR